MKHGPNGAALGRSSSGVLISKEPQLTVTAERGGSIVEIYVAGELDIAVRGLVTMNVAEVLAGKRQLTMLRVDVTAVTFIDSSGLRSLALACETARQHGLGFVLVVARSGPVGDLLEVAGMNEWFEKRSSAPGQKVSEPGTRRRYSAEYKFAILAEYDGLDRAGKGKLLLREGLYTSLLSEWRKQRDQGAVAALTVTPGRPAFGRIARENSRLRSRVERLEVELHRARRVIESQTTLAALLDELDTANTPSTASDIGAQHSAD